MSDELTMNDELTLSVVVCSYNGAARLMSCLEALVRQRLPVEIVVVDDGSSDDTSILAQRAGATVIRHEHHLGISAARNTGLRNSRSSVVAFCDDSCTPPDDWTENLLKAWNDRPDATVVGGLVEVEHPDSFAQRYQEFKNPLTPTEISIGFWRRLARQFQPIPRSSAGAFPVRSVVGVNMSMHRSRALEVGGFEINLQLNEGEVISLCAAVRERFGESSVVVDPRVVVAYGFEPSIARTLHRSFVDGQSDGERWRTTNAKPWLPLVGPTAIIATLAIAWFSWPIALIVGLAIIVAPCAIWFAESGVRRRGAIFAYPFVALADDLVRLAGVLRGSSRSPVRQRDLNTGVTRWPWTKEQWLVVAPTGLWLAGAVVLSIALALSHSPLIPLPGVVTMLLIPGASVMAALRTRPATTAGRVVLAVCLSMLVIMVVGGVASFIGPHIGIAKPLNAVPESLIWLVLALAMLTVGAAKNRDPVGWVFDDIHTPNVYGAIVGGLLVILSILGVAQLNKSGDNFLSVFTICLDVLVLVAGVVGSWKRTSQWPLSALLYGASLALLLSASLRGGHLDGWDVQQEFGIAQRTIHHGAWVAPANGDPYASMLSLTVLPSVLHSLVKLRLLAFFQLVVPAILALLPVAIFTTIRRVPRWITYGRVAPRPGLAFGVTVGLIVSSVAFSAQLVGITRQAMALTMLTALVMVLFDRTMLKRPAQVVIGMLLIAISFTHYTTSYLVAAILLCAWVVSWLWSKGLLGTPRSKRAKHRHDVNARRVINSVLVVVAIAAAFGWNLGVTHNYALSAPANAISSKGAGFVTSSNSLYIPPHQLERLIVSELHKQDSWIVPVPHSDSVKLKNARVVKSPGVTPALVGSWNRLSHYTVESVWLLLGIALLYGLFRLGRRRGYEYSSDLVGLAVAGLLVGAVLRFSGTLAAFYNPERAAIFTAILLAAPVTLFLDDLARLSREVKALRHEWVKRATLVVGVAFLSILVIGATGLSDLIFGGVAPENLVAKGLNVQDNTVSTPEVATAVWLQSNVTTPEVVQSDLFGHLVLLSEPGSYSLLDEIVPPDVNVGSYIYLSTVNLKDHTFQATAPFFSYLAIYKSTTAFFDKNFFVVYSTGVTRVYH